MAAQTFKCKLDRTDRIFPPNATFPGGVRVRPGETLEADLAEPEQDAVFTEDNYEVVLETPIMVPFDS